MSLWLFLLICLPQNWVESSSDVAAIKNRRNTQTNVRRLKVVHWYFFPYRRSGIDARMYDDQGKPYDKKKPRVEHGFTFRFPSPPIKDFSLNRGVKKHCEHPKTVEPCLEYLYKTLHKAKAQKGDVLLTSKEDFAPFRDRYERFQFRSTALYYLCWHTMKRDPALKFFGFNCGPTPFDRSDYRYDNANGPPWGCAMVTFCPDPCCGNVTTSTAPLVKGEMSREDDPSCTSHPSYPCRSLQNATCRVDLERNTNLENLKANRMNVTCGCPKGYRWSTPASQCFDIDECYELTHGCKESRVCRNEDGKYRCDCLYGYIYDAQLQQCIKHVELDDVLAERRKKEQEQKKQAIAQESPLSRSWLNMKQELFRAFAIPPSVAGHASSVHHCKDMLVIMALNILAVLEIGQCSLARYR